MSETPGPKARFPSVRYGRAAAVPSGKTVSMCPTSSTRRPPRSLDPASLATKMSPYRCSPVPGEWAIRSIAQPCEANRFSITSATSFTPAGR
jgi:hypothetical protein